MFVISWHTVTAPSFQSCPPSLLFTLLGKSIVSMVVTNEYWFVLGLKFVLIKQEEIMLTTENTQKHKTTKVNQVIVTVPANCDEMTIVKANRRSIFIGNISVRPYIVILLTECTASIATIAD